MNNVKQNHILLNINELKSLELQGKVSLRIQQGQVWITAKNDPKDYVVKAGDCIEFLAGQSDILLQSLSDETEIEVKLCA